MISLRYKAKFTGFLLLVLFIFYYVGITGFPHVHKIDNISFVHSHPCSNEVNHQHSARQLLVISDLSYFVSFAILILFFHKEGYILLSILLLFIYSFLPASSCFHQNYLRPPPTI